MIFQVGNWGLRWYGLLIGIAVIGGLLLAETVAKRRQLDPIHIRHVLGWLVIFSIPLARFYYVVFTWQVFQQQPWWSVFAIWQGGLAIHGALVGGALGLYFYSQKHELEFWHLADIIMPSVCLGQAIGRWGNFFNLEAYGQVIAEGSPILVQLQLPDGSRVHPTFLYESIWTAGLGIFLLWLVWRRPFLKSGTILSVYLVGYGLGRFWIENYRADSLMMGDLQAAQVLSTIFGLVGILALWYLYGLSKPQSEIWAEGWLAEVGMAGTVVERSVPAGSQAELDPQVEELEDLGTGDDQENAEVLEDDLKQSETGEDLKQPQADKDLRQPQADKDLEQSQAREDLQQPQAGKDLQQSEAEEDHKKPETGEELR